jgi:hypothetical protein
MGSTPLQAKGFMVNRKIIKSATTGRALLLILVLSGLSACSLVSGGRLVYDQEGIRIGVEADPSVSRSSQPAPNNHPIDLTPKEIESLLQVIQVSGYSGTLVGMFAKPQPVPLFTPQELSTISGHLATAFREAKPTERVFFSLPKPDVTYSEDRTVGFLFFRGRYLHVALTDHSSLIRTDTGGGEVRDIRDTKGMRLWVTGPVPAAMVPDLEEPRWAHFEKVHVSLNVKEVLGQNEKVPVARMNQGGTGAPVPLPTASSPEVRQGSASTEDVQLQIRELSGTNQELRGRLDEQNKRMQQLQDQVEQLRGELSKSYPKGQSYKILPAQ